MSASNGKSKEILPPLEEPNATGDACVALDSDWRIVYANAEAARIAREPIDALIGRNHWDKWPILRGTHVETTYRRVATLGESAQFEHQLKSPDGQFSVWLEGRAQPRNGGGLTVYFRDITQRKRAEIDAAEELRRARLVQRIAEAAVRADDARSVLETAITGLAETLELDRCYYVQHDPAKHIGTVACEWRRPNLSSIAGDYPLAAYTSDFTGVYDVGRTQVVSDTQTDDLADHIPLPRALIDRLGLTALIRVPLTTGASVNALVAAMTTGPREWTLEEVALVRAVAGETAEAVRALQAQERHRRIATVLQDALQPGIARDIPSLDVAAYLKPALDEANVGGDFYDIFALDGDKYALVIGDVSGKGLEAAAQVASLRNMLRAFLYKGASPGEAATDLNTIMGEHDLLTGFATLFVAIYDPHTTTVAYASCGHEHPIVLSGKSENQIKTCGPPIGAAPRVEYSTEHIDLEPGDILVLYTDGLSEAGSSRSRMLGVGRLTDIVRRNADDGGRKPGAQARNTMAMRLAGDIMADVLKFADGRLRDDACLIVAQRTDAAPGHSDEIRPSHVVATGPLTRAGDSPIAPMINGLVTDSPEEEQLRLLIDTVSEYAIFLLDVKGHIVTWNKGAERIQGYSAAEIIGKHFSIFYMPEDVQRGHPIDELALAASEGRYEEEGWRVRKDGGRFWANVVITALFDRHGNLCGYGKVTRDFTERRSAEQQLRRSEERFRYLVQGVKDYAIFMLDPTGHVASWNEGAYRIKGYQAHEIIGQHFSRFYTTEDLASGKPERELTIATAEGKYEEEGWRLRKDGSRFWANVLITALRDDAGSLYGFVKITRDFTERKMNEESRIKVMRDDVSRTFLREILYSVSEGRLRFCDVESELPRQLPTLAEEREFARNDLHAVRACVLNAAKFVDFPADRVDDVVTSVSEAAMNAVVHATGSSFRVCGDTDSLQVWIRDHGRGIEIANLHKATLERGFTTEGSLGHGFWLMLHTCDRLWLRSTSAGTTVVLEVDATVPEPAWLTRPRDLTQYMR